MTLSRANFELNNAIQLPWDFCAMSIKMRRAQFAAFIVKYLNGSKVLKGALTL